jgi:hypothetical protein
MKVLFHFVKAILSDYNKPRQESTKRNISTKVSSLKDHQIHFLFLLPGSLSGSKAGTPEIITDFNRTIQDALNSHYCISFIPSLLDFNFQSLLSHFKWCCKFLYFNFCETTMPFDIFKRLKAAAGVNRNYIPCWPP